MAHLAHAEDLILTQGAEGLRHSVEHLLGVARRLTHGESHVEVTQKWDGKLALFFGWDPTDGKFFVGTKTVFNKVPVLLKTAEDVANYPVAAIHEHLLTALKLLKPITPTHSPTVWQADLLYIRPMLHMVKDNITFKPNTITYSVSRHSDLGQIIWGSELGLVIHTKYVSLQDQRAYYNPDLKTMGVSHYVWWAPATIGAPKHRTLGELDMEAVHAFTNLALKAGKRLTSSFYSIISTSQIANALMRAMNNQVRAGHDIRLNHHDLALRLLADIKGQLAKSKLGMLRVKSLVAHGEEFLALASILSDLTNAKLILVRALEKNEHDVKSIGQGPEGFVSIKNGSTVKLVDRLSFSKTNFERHG